VARRRPRPARLARFVVFGQSRSGSTLLLLLLGSHPCVGYDRELLNPDHGYLRGRLRLAAGRALPALVAHRWSTRSQAPVYGFKLLVSQVRSPRLTLRALHLLGWRIVHIEREDVIAQALSGLVASRSGRWGREPGEELEVPRIRIEPPELVRAVRERLGDREAEQRAIAGLPHLTVLYERDLLDEDARARTVAALCRYLGIDERKLTARTARLYDVPYTRIVDGGEELVQQVEAELGAELGRATACALAPSS